jgi:aspartyl-tRNA(Asn)/glutamyl-tRNA(Gln) amidotransferase subunit A
MPMIPSFDTAGPIARSARDCRMVFEVLVGYDPAYEASSRAPVGRRPAGNKIGLARRMFSYATTDVRLAVEAAARTFVELGVTVEEVDGPDPDRAWTAAVPFWTEYGDAFRDLWNDERVSSEPAFLLTFAQQITGLQVAEAIRVRREVARAFDDAFETYDALLYPATPFVAPRPHDEIIECEGGRLDVRTGCARFTAAANVTGLPALAFPVGFDEAGMPIGAQLVGPAWSEHALLALGERYQSATEWHTRTA